MEPEVSMNPVLLKPTGAMGSQVIVEGQVLGNMSAKEYFAFKRQLVPYILKAFHSLEQKADIIVMEGAGSPAEINLRENDIVNMGMAELVDAPVLLAGDIDRGGVFAQLYGTVELLEEAERARIKGLIVNKFRGDRAILEPGIRMLEDKCKIPVTGVIPMLELAIEDEDSLSARLDRKRTGLVDIAVIRFPRISNFTDFAVFEQLDGVSVRYVTRVEELGNPHAVFLPGSKNTLGDLKWMRESGLEAAVRRKAADTLIWGICGGYQMLGMRIEDPYGTEEGGCMRGMELLPIETVLEREKVTRQTEGEFGALGGILKALSGKSFSGYEIHMGRSFYRDRANSRELSHEGGGSVLEKGLVYGSYVHGIFDRGEIAALFTEAIAAHKGVEWKRGTGRDYRAFKESQYDKLAAALRENLDMDAIYGMLREARSGEEQLVGTAHGSRG